MNTDFDCPVVGVHSIQGDRELNCDTAAQYWDPETGILAVTVVDGTHNKPEVAEVVPLLAQTAVRVGTREGALIGLIAATFIVAKPHKDLPEPDGVMALAVLPRNSPAAIAHVGDCRVWSWQDNQLHQDTVDHTAGERMRQQGDSEELAAEHDNEVFLSIARATVFTVPVTTSHAEVLLLTSDGVHKNLTNQQLAELLDQHAADPQACAEAIVAEARANGSRDDATAVVVARPSNPPEA